MYSNYVYVYIIVYIYIYTYTYIHYIIYIHEYLDMDIVTYSYYSDYSECCRRKSLVKSAELGGTCWGGAQVPLQKNG